MPGRDRTPALPGTEGRISQSEGTGGHANKADLRGGPGPRINRKTRGGRSCGKKRPAAPQYRKRIAGRSGTWARIRGGRESAICRRFQERKDQSEKSADHSEGPPPRFLLANFSAEDKRVHVTDPSRRHENRRRGREQKTIKRDSRAKGRRNQNAMPSNHVYGGKAEKKKKKKKKKTKTGRRQQKGGRHIIKRGWEQRARRQSNRRNQKRRKAKVCPPVIIGSGQGGLEHDKIRSVSSGRWKRPKPAKASPPARPLVDYDLPIWPASTISQRAGGKPSSREFEKIPISGSSTPAWGLITKLAVRCGDRSGWPGRKWALLATALAVGWTGDAYPRRAVLWSSPRSKPDARTQELLTKAGFAAWPRMR